MINKRFEAFWILFFLAFGVKAAEDINIEQAFLQCSQRYAADAESRLDCFDRIAKESLNAQTQAGATMKLAADKHRYFGNTVEASLTPLSYIERKWRLNSKDNWDVSDLEAHHLNYLATINSSHPNDVASTPSRPNTIDRELDKNDMTFQLSLKTQLVDDIPIIRDWDWVDSSRLWAAYTQQSFWQVYNQAQSRPMREHNYSPELILSLGVSDTVNGKHYAYLPRMLNLGVIHESNGRSNPISRSWNRIYLQSAWQLNDAYTLLVRPWWRIPETKANDDNPDIDKFLGYGDLTLRWDNFAKDKSASILVRNNLRSDNKGYVKLDMSYGPFDRDNLKLYLMLQHGYGISLVDYNYSQTVFGVGFAVGE